MVRAGVDNPGVRDALLVSVKAALGATAIALLLGSLAALAVARTASSAARRSIVNVVAVFVILLSMIPVYFASKLSSESAGPGATGVAGDAR